MAAEILQGDALTVLPTLPGSSIDCVVTSPPYYGLRDYDGVEPTRWPDGSECDFGHEETPELYVEHSMLFIRELWRVLKDTGVLWWNVGDTRGDTRCLQLIPQRLMLATQSEGWIIRSVCVWAKIPCMPESVNGWRWERHKRKRVANAHYNARVRRLARLHSATRAGLDARKSRGRLDIWEDCPGCEHCERHGGYVLRKAAWRPTSGYEFVIMATRSEKHYGDRYGFREECARSSYERAQHSYSPSQDRLHDKRIGRVWPCDRLGDRFDPSEGRNMRDVWLVTASGTREPHYAAFPEEIPTRCILSSTPRWVCSQCGAPYARVAEGERKGEWWATCDCSAEKKPPVVLDPFCGTGTTLVAAVSHGRDAIGIEASPKYCEVARRRVAMVQEPLALDF